MIVYQLACGQGHFFEGWFASSEACDRQAASGDLQCPACSSADVRKLPSAPYVKSSGESAAADAARARAHALQALRTFIVTNTEDVGRRFAEVARRMHYQEEKARNIRGQVTSEEAAELHEEGVPAFAISPEVIPSEEVH
jgi:hypothetical protein